MRSVEGDCGGDTFETRRSKGKKHQKDPDQLERYFFKWCGIIEDVKMTLNDLSWGTSWSGKWMDGWRRL